VEDVGQQQHCQGSESCHMPKEGQSSELCLRYSMRIDNHDLDTAQHEHGRKEKGKFALFSDHNGSLLRRQPGAMSMGYKAA